MRATLPTLALLALAACQPGQLTAVHPATLLLGQTVDVTIEGDGTHFGDDSAVDLGPGVVVSEVRADSANTLVVRVTVGTAAALGPHEVRVDAAAPLADGLHVASAASLTLPEAASRGAVLVARLRPTEGQLDTATPLDAVTVRASAGLTAQPLGFDGDALRLRLAIDPSAPLGDAALEVRVGPDAYPIASAFSVGPASIASILDDVLDVPLTADVGRLVWVPAWSGLAFVDVALEPGWPQVGLLPADAAGRYPRPWPTAATVTRVIDTPLALAVYAPDAPGTAHLTARRVPLRPVEVLTPRHDALSAALLGTPDAWVVDQRLASATDAHFFAVDVPPDATDLKLEVVTLGDALTDTAIDVLRDDFTTPFGPASVDDAGLDRLLTPTVITGGRYYVRVSAGRHFDPGHGTYSLAVVTR